MSTISKNITAVHAITASLVVAGTISGASQGMAMDNYRENPFESVNKIYRDYIRERDIAANDRSSSYRTIKEMRDSHNNTMDVGNKLSIELFDEVMKKNGRDPEKIEKLSSQLDTFTQIQSSLNQQKMEKIQLQSAAQNLEHQKITK